MWEALAQPIFFCYRLKFQSYSCSLVGINVRHLHDDSDDDGIEGEGGEPCTLASTKQVQVPATAAQLNASHSIINKLRIIVEKK